MTSVMGIFLPERLIASFKTAVIPPQQGTSIRRTGHASYRRGAEDLGELRHVLRGVVELGAADQHLPAWQELLVETRRRKGSAVRSHQQIGVLQERRDVPISLIWIGHWVSRTSLSFAAGAAFTEEQDGQSSVWLFIIHLLLGCFIVQVICIAFYDAHHTPKVAEDCRFCLFHKTS